MGEPVFIVFENMSTVLFGQGPEVIKLFLCSTQLRLKFILLINVKMATMLAF